MEMFLQEYESKVTVSAIAFAALTTSNTSTHTSVLSILCLSSCEVTPACQASDLESVETWGQLHYSMYSTSEASYLRLITKSFTLASDSGIFTREWGGNVLEMTELDQNIMHGELRKCP